MTDQSRPKPRQKLSLGRVSTKNVCIASEDNKCFFVFFRNVSMNDQWKAEGKKAGGEFGKKGPEPRFGKE